MSQVDELIDGLTDEEIAAYSADPSTEPHIVVNSDRSITVPSELRRIAVQFDHNIETVTFDCPRYWDGHDMSAMTIYINYLCPGGVTGSFACENVTVDSTDSNIMHFDWIISRNVTMNNGALAFLVCVVNVDDEGNEINHWNSELCKDLYVSEGLEALESTLEDYPDLITQLLTRMDNLYLSDKTIELDPTLSVEGAAADSAAVGTAIEAAKNEAIANATVTTDTTLSVSGAAADSAAVGTAIKNAQPVVIKEDKFEIYEETDGGVVLSTKLTIAEAEEAANNKGLFLNVTTDDTAMDFIFMLTEITNTGTTGELVFQRITETRRMIVRIVVAADGTMTTREVTDEEFGTAAIYSDSDGSIYRYSTDGEKEYFNPRGVLDVEYRTIERFNGYPVYTKYVEYLDGTSVVEYTTETSVTPIRYTVINDGELHPYSDPTSTSTTKVRATGNRISLSLATPLAVYVQVWYIKASF